MDLPSLGAAEVMSMDLNSLSMDANCKFVLIVRYCSEIGERGFSFVIKWRMLLFVFFFFTRHSSHLSFSFVVVFLIDRLGCLLLKSSQWYQALAILIFFRYRLLFSLCYRDIRARKQVLHRPYRQVRLR